MKRNYIVSTTVMVLLLLTGLFSCRNKPGAPTLQQASKELVIDSSVAALAKPVHSQVVAALPPIEAQRSSRIASVTVSGVITYDTRHQTSLASRVSGRIERLLVKYNYQPVRKGQLIMEIYSPDLAAAQRELIFVAKNSPEMLAPAKQRLLLLGMSASQIERVISTGNILYRVPVYSHANGYILEQSAVPARTATPGAAAMAPSSGSSGGMDGMNGNSAAGNNAVTLPTTAPTPVMIREGQYISAGQTIFTIYQATNLVAEFAFPAGLAPQVKQGQKLSFYPDGDKEAVQTGRIGLIEPVFRNGQSFLTARVYLEKNNYRAGQLLTGMIHIVYSNALWLPKEALWQLGARSIVFKKEQGVYRPVTVQTGPQVDGFIQISTDITGWQVAPHAAYLVDSESFIKAHDKEK